MKKILFISILCLFIVNNSYSQPNWINNSKNGCKSNEICAVGFGNTLNLSKSDARRNISKYFKTEIKGQFKSELTAKNNNINENVYDAVLDETSGVFSGIEIKETYSDKNGFYSLATLNKEKMAKSIEHEINKLDLKMEVLLEEKSNKNIRLVEQLFLQREELNKTYLFLTGKEIPNKISLKEIAINKKQNSKNLKYFVNISSSKNELKNRIEKLLTDSGNIIVKNEINSNRTINVNLSFQEEYLDVENFVKRTVLLKIDCYDNGNLINSIETQITDTGRNEGQIYSKNINNLLLFLEENFYTLIN